MCWWNSRLFINGDSNPWQLEPKLISRPGFDSYIYCNFTLSHHLNPQFKEMATKIFRRVRQEGETPALFLTFAFSHLTVEIKRLEKVCVQFLEYKFPRKWKSHTVFEAVYLCFNGKRKETQNKNETTMQKTSHKKPVCLQNSIQNLFRLTYTFRDIFSLQHEFGFFWYSLINIIKMFQQ